jgi:hypothetical protein
MRCIQGGIVNIEETVHCICELPRTLSKIKFLIILFYKKGHTKRIVTTFCSLDEKCYRYKASEEIYRRKQGTEEKIGNYEIS